MYNSDWCQNRPLRESKKSTTARYRTLSDKETTQIPARRERASFSGVSYPWSLYHTHFHHRHSRKKAKIQRPLWRFNDVIFIWMDIFLKETPPRHHSKSIQAIWRPPERRVNQDSMAVCWLRGNIMLSSRRSYQLRHCLATVSWRTSFSSLANVWQEPQAGMKNRAPAESTSTLGKLHQALFSMGGCWN